MKPAVKAIVAISLFSHLVLCAALVLHARPELGIFSDHEDIGPVGRKGSAAFDPASGSYTIAGGGENLWFASDAFHFAWKKVTGDIALAGDIRFEGKGGNPHRKACLIIRQSLNPDSPYADAVLHGDGLASLQYRETAGGPTREIRSNVTGPARLRIEKRGSYVTMWVARTGESMKPAGGNFRIEFQEPFYIGLAVCAHEKDGIEKAVFSNVEVQPLQTPVDPKLPVDSTLEIIAVESGNRHVVYQHARERIEAPNWTQDGKTLIFNRSGHLYRMPTTGGEPTAIDTGFAVLCNNDHGLSPDGTEIVISDRTVDKKSRIYILPFAGGIPRLITPLAPSYWHGWSPDGKTLTYCAERNGEFDIYTIPAVGGVETRLTTAPGLDDGPEYSPDGKYIYFNSVRTGLMQIWRMKPDGSGQEQMTFDEYNNWFAHPSPDGKQLVLISYPKNVEGHPENQDVMLRLMPAGGGQVQVLTKLFGGQGTINVPSWSPDSKNVAFVSYRRVYP
jgi:TolB protein